jgi:hypothetical protein
VIPDEAVEAAAYIVGAAIYGDLTPREAAQQILEAAAPHLLREVWQSAYDQGVDDERISQANPGIVGCFCSDYPCRCFIAPARANPYRKPTP